LSHLIDEPRLYTTLLGIFATLALVLAAVGIYGVMSYAVAQRTHEIGIRMALGANRREVMRLVISQGMRLAGLGIAIGAVVTVVLTRLLASLLFNVSATDLKTFLVTAALLSFVALLACGLPALRATRVDPMVALRCE